MNDETIWLKHRDELIRYATVLVGRDAAEDVLASVVERTIRSKVSLAALTDARPYLFRAVLNESRNHARRLGRRAARWTTEVEWPPEVRPEVVSAVASLPTRQRAAVYWTYWRDLPLREVAEVMGCRIGTVKRYLHLARNRLEEVLSP